MLLDAFGKQCPMPLVMAKKALDEGERDVQIKVDNDTAVKNLSRLATKQNLGFEVETIEGGYLVKFSAEGAQAGQAQATVAPVLAGMGGDLIVRILSACSWRAREGLTLVLQPQSAGNVLRRWLYSEGLELLREEPVQDGSFLYTVMQLRAGSPAPLTPGQEYASPALLQSGNPLVGAYLAHVETALIATVEGLTGAEKQRPERLAYFSQALHEIQEMRKYYGDNS